MPWELLDHQADVGLQATGETLEVALEDGVRGMLALMVEPRTIRPEQTYHVEASGSDPGSLFVDLLNEVLAEKDIENAFFNDIVIDELREDDDGWHVSCRLFGESIDLSRHIVDSDVKAATYGGLRVHHDENGWLLRCVLDL